MNETHKLDGLSYENVKRVNRRVIVRQGLSMESRAFCQRKGLRALVAKSNSTQSKLSLACLTFFTVIRPFNFFSKYPARTPDRGHQFRHCHLHSI